MSSFLGFVMDKRAERRINKTWSDWVNTTFKEILQREDVYPKTFEKIYTDALGAFMIKILNEGLTFFSFLEQPRTFDTINEHFGFQNTEYVKIILDAFATYGYLEKNLEKDTYVITSYYKETEKNVDKKMEFYNYIPYFFKAGSQYKHILPLKMKSNDEVARFIMSSKKENVSEKTVRKESAFKWDLALTQVDMYEKLRINTMVYGDLFNRKGKFLDLGCGNGHGTLNIWKYYFDRGYFDTSKRKIQLYGVDPTQELLNIAKDEFSYWLSQGLQQPKTKIEEKYHDTIPTFTPGKASKIPYEDNFFDVVYISESLHFDDYTCALPEMFRVIKPGGIVVGNEFLEPLTHTGFLFFEGSKGCVPVEEYYRVLRDINAKNVRVHKNDIVVYFKYSK